MKIETVHGIVVLSLGLTLTASWLGPANATPPVPCDVVNSASRTTMVCEGCGGECPYPDDECLKDRLSCERDACADVLDLHSVQARCEEVPSQQAGTNDITPNIVLLVADDWNWVMRGTVGGYSTWREYLLQDNPEDNPMLTPTLDRLAEEGAYFPVAHTSASVCIPAIASILTGRYGKDLDDARPVVAPTLPRLMSDSHCSVSIGKVWSARFDQLSRCLDCCDPGDVDCTADTCCGDPRAGFHYSVEQDDRIFHRKIGRRRDSLDKGTCYLRAINTARKPFFAWLLPYMPHWPYLAPAGFEACYDAADGLGVRIDGEQTRNPGPDYLGMISWLDCVTASVLDFLETTPDARFCEDPNACPACTRPCGTGDDCGDPDGEKAQCVDSRCVAAQPGGKLPPCLIDTTVIIGFNDNGKGLSNSKWFFGENGYRSPLSVSYGRLGVYDRTELETIFGMPPAVQPRIYHDKMAHALDLVPTILHYADATDGGSVGPEHGRDQRGRSIRPLIEGSGVPWRQFLFGHTNRTNTGVLGGQRHYVRAPRNVGEFVRFADETLSPPTGPGACESDVDCQAQGWNAAGLLECINGVCTKSCTPSGSECNDLNEKFVGASPDRDVQCINDACAVASACKVHRGERSQEVFNLANDPDENVNLLLGGPAAEVADPLHLCYSTAQGTPGSRRFAQLSCELARWCLEGCEEKGLPCSSCLPDLCAECTRLPNCRCLKDGTCYFAGKACFDCRRRCTSDAECADLGVACIPDPANPAKRRCDERVAQLR